MTQCLVFKVLSYNKTLQSDSQFRPEKVHVINKIICQNVVFILKNVIFCLTVIDPRPLLLRSRRCDLDVQKLRVAVVGGQNLNIQVIKAL